MKIKLNGSKIILLSILILAAVVRFWGINFGLPHQLCRPDEEMIVSKSLYFLTGDLNPRWFVYPTFYMYIVSFFYFLYFLFSMLIGTSASLADFLAKYFIDPSAFYIIDRSVSAFLGTATVFIVYKSVRELFDKNTAIVAAFFLALAYLHVRDSHFGVTDVPMAFFITTGFLFIVKSYKDGSLRNYLLAGIFTGLAASTKYLGGLLIVPMFLAHCLNISNESKKVRHMLFDSRIIAFALASIAAFFIGTPFALLNWLDFIADIVNNGKFLSIKYSTVFHIREVPNWKYQLSVSLFYGLGWPVLLSSVLGLAILIKTDLKKAFLLLLFPAAYYVYMGGWYAACVRYSIPVIPFLCIIAAFFVTKSSYFFLKNINPKIKITVLALFSLIILYPSLFNLIKLDQLLARKDTRLMASEWVVKNIKRDSTIYQSGLNTGKLFFYPALVSVGYKKWDYLESDKMIMAEVFKDNRNYFKDIDIQHYNELLYDMREGVFISGKEKAPPPDYIIIQQSPLRLFSCIPTKIVNIVTESYFLRQEFKAINFENKKNIFDQEDAFYLPFAGFEEVERPGPNIYIYEKIKKDDIIKGI